MLAHDRMIALQGAHNVRDLGGYRTADGGVTRWRSILRGDALHQLTGGDIEALLGHGLTTVIDLRNAHELAAEANPFLGHAQVRYHNTPLFSALAPIEMMAGSEALRFDMAERYCRAVDECQPAIAEVLRSIVDAPEGTVLFHCSAGKDRTGLITALLLANAGVDNDVIIADYALTATLSGPLIGNLRQRALARGTDPGLLELVLSSEPRNMRILLDHLEETYGDVPRYLGRIGLTATDSARLRQRLI